jgi:hypothetical protein
MMRNVRDKIYPFWGTGRRFFKAYLNCSESVTAMRCAIGEFVICLFGRYHFNLCQGTRIVIVRRQVFQPFIQRVDVLRTCIVVKH